MVVWKKNWNMTMVITTRIPLFILIANTIKNRSKAIPKYPNSKSGFLPHLASTKKLHMLTTEVAIPIN